MPEPLASRQPAAWVLGTLIGLSTIPSPLAAPGVLGRDPGAVILTGTYQFGHTRHSIATVWHLRRDETRLMATALGALESQEIRDAVTDGRGLRFLLRLGSGDTAQSFAFDGRFTGRQMIGRLVGPGQNGKLLMSATSQPVVERGLVLALVSPDGTPGDVVRLSVVLDEIGSLIAGRFASEDSADCSRLGCAGQVTAFHENSAGLLLSLLSDAACPVMSNLTLTFDTSSLLYSGGFTTSGCATASGNALGARTTGTRGEDASQILQGLGRLADDLEHDAPLARPHPSFSPDYLHSGRSLDDLFAGFEQDTVRFSSRRVSFDPVRNIRTTVDPLAFPGIDLPPLGVTFEDRREGTPRAGGSAQVYVDSQNRPGPPRLSVWAEEGGRWVIRGNGYAGYDLPFVYTTTDRSLEVPTPGGLVHVSPGPFGAHTGPLTGHIQGDGKANLIGYLSYGDTEMVDLGNGDGVRDPGEPWGFFGGADGSVVRARNPVYIAPADGVLGTIRYAPPNGMYFDNVPHWAVDVHFPDGTTIGLGHLGGIARELRDRVLDGLGIDLWTYAGPEGVVVEHDSGIRLQAGDTLAFPQVMAQPLPGHPGYYVAPDGGVPWAQMEFGFIASVFADERANSCVYEHLPWASHDAIQRVIDNEMNDPFSTRYRPFARERWLWSAEGRACMAYTLLPVDFRSLDTRLGGWFERPSPGVDPDEIFVIFDMARETAAFTPSLYDSGNTGRLVRRQRAFGLPPFAWVMPDGTVVQPFYPAGEVLERTPSALLIKWRDIGYRDVPGLERPAYQWASYLLDASGLKVRWGPFLDHPDAGSPPPLTAAMSCNGSTVVCYDHTERPGF
jgi:hypothetical protein